VSIKTAVNGAQALEYITGISEGIRTVSVNNSSVVDRELKPLLVSNGFTVNNSYFTEFDIKEKTIRDYWDIPALLEKDLAGSFDISVRMEGLARPAGTEVRRYLSVLGVNAASADDGTVFFLQHFSNIFTDLMEAEKVVLIIGLDKIFCSRDDAALVTRCMGTLGMESWLLGIQPRASEPAILAQAPLSGSKRRELHVVILDNGRTGLLNTKFNDLLLCIGCRACNRHCPIRHSFADVDHVWSPKNYLKDFLDKRVDSVDKCIHCEACRLDCPLDIDVPGLMWQAKLDHIGKHGISFYHRILGRPETLARVGTPLAPVANWMVNVRPFRVLMEFAAGIDRNARLPMFHRETFRKWFSRSA
jgi:L-lactate utilization protein LutB